MRDFIIVLAVASLSLTWASAAWAEKQRCLKEVVSVEGSADVASKLGRESAVAAWRRHVSATAGESYAVWSLAQGAHIRCDRARRLSGKCVAHGTPCRAPHIRED